VSSAFGEVAVLERCVEILERVLCANDPRTYDTLIPLYAQLDALTSIASDKVRTDEPPPDTSQRGGNDEAADDVVDHEHVKAGAKGVDYDRLVKKFGSNLLRPAHLARIAAISGQTPHLFLRRGLFFSHRDLDDLFDAHERGERFYIFTGRGPSASMHLGHLVPFMFAADLQRRFNAPVVIQISDDEKFFFKGLSLHAAATYAQDNILDIIACGFDPSRTFVFRDTQMIGALYPMVCEIQRKLTVGQIANTFGVRVQSRDGEPTDCLGKLLYPAVQMAPAFAAGLPAELFGGGGEGGGRRRAGSPPRPSRVPLGLDQDPNFSVVRNLAA